jgi:hypothetical protein
LKFLNHFDEIVEIPDRILSPFDPKSEQVSFHAPASEVFPSRIPPVR